MQIGDTSTNYQIQPGDRIFVPGRSLVEELLFLCDKDPVCNCGEHHLCPIGKEDCCAHAGGVVGDAAAPLHTPKPVAP